MNDNEPTETDGGQIQPYDPKQAIPGVERVSGVADALEEFNRVLFEIAKSFWIITAMLLGIFLLLIAYNVVEYVVML